MVPLRTLLPVFALMLGLAFPAGAQSRRGELRGLGLAGGSGRDWPALMRSLRDSGFNGVFASLLAGTSEARDELGPAIRAARENDVELHFWLPALSMYDAPAALTAQLEAAGRLQRNAEGRLAREDPAGGGDWLCPSHTANRELLVEITSEVVRSYDPAGILVSHLGFPSADYCLCEQCRPRFEKEIGGAVAAWPEEVLRGRLAGRWRQWRRAQIGGLMEEITETARRIKPEIFISFAPRGGRAEDEQAADWPDWVRSGMLDFVCPTVPVGEGPVSADLLREQVEAGRGAVPIYLGCDARETNSAWPVVQMVETSRRQGMDGFVLFVPERDDYTQWLSPLRATVASADPDPRPHRGPPASFRLGGPAATAPADGWRVIANTRLEVELTVGTPPTAAEESLEPGAEYISSILRRATDVRRPTTQYEPDSLPTPGAEDRVRIFGRVVAEDPSGMSLGSLTAFDADEFVKRKLRLTTPAGPFRIAVYGSLQVGSEEPREFVVRGPLLVGSDEESLGVDPQARHAELDRLAAAACERLDLTRLAGVKAAIQLTATGPGGGEWWLRLSEGRCETGRGVVEDPDLSLTCSVEEALALVRSEVDPEMLWREGRLRVTGNHNLLPVLARAGSR